MKTEEGQRSIKDWMKVFRELYSEADSERTPEQMWVAVMAHTSSIGESIRKVAFESLLKSAAHTFCWLCSFVNKCNDLQKDDIFSINETLCGIVSLKYPGICGHCQHRPCDCDPVRMETKKDKSARYENLLDLRNTDWKSFKGYSIENYRKMFYNIYYGKLHIQTLENIGFHFLEEIGEAAVCVRQLSQLRKIADDDSTGIDSAFLKHLTTVEGIVKDYVKYGKDPIDINYASREQDMLRARVVGAKMDLVGEIADSFSWFCAILNKLDSISKSIYDDHEKHKDVLPSLEQVLTKEYLDSHGNAICPRCNRNPCNCVFYNLTTGNQYRRVTLPSRKKRKIV